MASGLIYDLAPGTTFTVTAVKITGDVNYEDAEKTGLTKEFTTNAAPTNTVEEQFGDMETYCASSYFKDWAGSEIVLSGPGDLAALAYMVNTKHKTFEGQTIKLGKNIDCSSFVWTPIKGLETVILTASIGTGFKGTFDGGGHTISGLYSTGYGLFAKVSDGAVIQNVTLEDCYFTRNGGLVGGVYVVNTGGNEYKNGSCTVTNCTSNATITGTTDATYRLETSTKLPVGCTVRPLREKV